MRNYEKELAEATKKLGARESYLVKQGLADIWIPKDKSDREFMRCLEHNLFVRCEIKDDEYWRLDKQVSEILDSMHMQGLHELVEHHLTVATHPDNNRRYGAIA